MVHICPPPPKPPPPAEPPAGPRGSRKIKFPISFSKQSYQLLAGIEIGGRIVLKADGSGGMGSVSNLERPR